jgi:hypothetical protein
VHVGTSASCDEEEDQINFRSVCDGEDNKLYTEGFKMMLARDTTA